MKKRAFSLFLALILCLSLLPVPALAAGEDNTRIPYAVTGGNIYFNAGTGEIVDSDEKVTAAVIPATINDVSVTGIGEQAFAFRSALTSVTIPDSVTSIGDWAFRSCNRLTSVTIPASVTSIEGNPVQYCRGLTNIIVASNNANYCAEGGVLFNKDKTTLIAYPAGRSETTYQIPGTVTSIGAWAFSTCFALTSITIPASVTRIRSYAFENCIALSSVTIPASVTRMETAPFMGCAALTSIEVASGNPNYCTEDGVLFNKDKTNLIEYPVGRTGAYQIPGTVTAIGVQAFLFCRALTSVTIPNSVTSIGDMAFVSCDALTSIDVASGNPNYCAVDGVLFNKGKTELLAYPAGRSGIYRIPDTVTSIGAYAFNYSPKMTGVMIPASVTRISEQAFWNCNALTDVYYGGTQAQWQAITIETNNEPLLNATIHYNSSGPEPVKTNIAACTVTGIAVNGYEYTGSAITPAITVKDGSTVLTEGTDYSLTYKNNTAVGTATITVTGMGSYTGTKDVTFKITKTQPVKGTDYTVTLPADGAYTGATKAATATKTNAGIGSITVKYNGSTAAPVKAGTYAVTADIAESANFAAMTGVELGSFTISKAPLTLTSATVADKTYNGRTDDAAVTGVTFGGLVNGETLTLGTDYSASGVYAAADAGDSVAVTVTVTLKDTARANNYALSGSTVAATGKVAKTTTTLSLKAADAAYTGLAYDTANLTRTSNVETAPIYTYYADANGARGEALEAAPVNAGTYWVEGFIAATTNNSAVTSETVKFRITKAPLTITAKDHTITYGEAPANNGVEYEGFVNGETAGVVSGLTYAYTYEQYGNVGTYAINPTGATADNYQITLKPGKLTVAQKAVGLTWDGYEDLYYDGQAKAVTAAATGLVNDDAVTVTVAGGAQKDAGSYTAAATGLTGAKAANYKLPEDRRTQAYTIAYALEGVTASPATVTATIDQITRTIKLVGYAGADEEIELDGLTIEDGKVTVNGVEYTVDRSGVVANESGATLTETAPQVTKPEDADESVTDEVVEEINDAATGSEGLGNAGAEYIFGEAAKDETIDSVEVSVSIQPINMTAGISLKLEIKPIVTFKSEDEVVKTETLPNSAIKAPVTISVKLPAGLPTTGLVAKHSLGGGKFEYLTVTVSAGVASWQQRSFSQVELIADSRSATVNFTFENGSGQSITYTTADIGKALPTDSKSGSSFLGWLFEDVNGAQTTLTDALLTALDGQTVQAAPSFRTNGGWNPGGVVVTPEKPINPFEDIFESDYYYDAVIWAVKQEITAGVSETRFAPAASCTRAQAVTFLWRAAGEPKAVSAVNPFTDVSADAYYYDAVLWAVEQGIAAGVSETRFAPDATVTRGQMMCFLWRAAGKPAAGAAPFDDVDTDAYYAPAIAWAVDRHITQGVSAKAFAPEADCTRAQIVTFLYRHMGK